MRLSDLLDLAQLRLTLLTGAEQLDRPVGPVFITDLPDPRRYLSGGELVLTGLMWRRRPEDSARFVAALADAGVAALGAGDAALGCVPPDLVTACRGRNLALFEVPVEVSFAAIAAEVAERAAAERARARALVAALAQPAEPAPPAERADVRAAVLGCGLPVPASYAVLVASGSGPPVGTLAALVHPVAPGAVLADLEPGSAAAVVPGDARLLDVILQRARAGPGGLALGAGGPVTGAEGLPGALAEARYAHRTAEARRQRPAVVSGAELASHLAVLAGVPAPARAALRARLLDPLREYDRRHRAELVRTLTAFLECNGSWTRCAELLHVHVNTLRYRMARVEQLTGRDLDTFADRVDLFLALRLDP
jgi:hypothetical protein